MYYLQVKNLSHAFGTRTILSHIDMSIEKGQKIALVARNGMGKSTLLDLLMGNLECTSGDISRTKNIRIGFLSQQFVADQTMLVDTWIHQHTMSDSDYEEREHATKVKKIIVKLKLTKHLHQPIGSLSGGEQKRLALAKVLMDEPDMLVLDEPTNHLDLDMIEWLEKFLSKSSMTLLMVTHDRYFLERVCTQIIELERGKLYFYPGNYSRYIDAKAQRLEQEHKDTHIMKQLYHRELAWVKKAPRARESKSVKREQEFYDLQNNFQEKKKNLTQSAKKIEIARANTDETPKLGNKIIVLNKVCKSFGEKNIVHNFSHDFRQGERIGILGKNGVGKSTFLNILTDHVQADSGKIQRADNLRVGYYSQHLTFPEHVKVIDYAKSVAEWMMIGKEKITTTKLLDRFLFTPAQQQTRVHDLSGGEKRRLFLLTTLMKVPNFLILDEPTNDLDIETLTALEDFLLTFNGCLLVISHDRYFMDKIADRIFSFAGDGMIEDFQGNYSMRSRHKLATSANKKRGIESKSNHIYIPKEVKESTIDDSILAPKKNLTYNEKREFEGLIDQIQAGEDRKDAINLIFQTQILAPDELKTLGAELHTLIQSMQAKEERWLELSERA